MKSKQFCEECNNLPEGEVVRGHDHRNDYDLFIRWGRDAGFIDTQLNFLAEWLDISDGKEVSDCHKAEVLHEYDENICGSCNRVCKVLTT